MYSDLEICGVPDTEYQREGGKDGRTRYRITEKRKKLDSLSGLGNNRSRTERFPHPTSAGAPQPSREPPLPLVSRLNLSEGVLL